MDNKLLNRHLDVYINQNNDLVILTYSPNPFYDAEREAALDEEWKREWQEKNGSSRCPPRMNRQFPYRTAKTSFVLESPCYTIEDIAVSLEAAADAWGQFPAYKQDLDPIQLYTGIKNFKKASFGWRRLTVEWYERDGKTVGLSMPCKTPYMWIGISMKKLAPSADWIDYANAVYEFVTTDVTGYDSFKTFKRYLNLTPPK